MREFSDQPYNKYFELFLNSRQINKLFNRLDRTICKIAPLNNATGNTQTIFRWDLNKENPHFAKEVECKEILKNITEDLLGLLNIDDFKSRDYLKLFSERILDNLALKRILDSNSRIGNLEIPIWYKLDLNKGGKHSENNVFWFSPFNELYELRELQEGRIITKIQVKSYLTDRRQTGNYQTNREVRWETHPNSPQFATRINCMLIEAKLIAQVFTFNNAPPIPKDKVYLIEKALNEQFKKDSFRCPISGKPIDYNDFFEKVVLNPIHGRSGYQIGHLIPLSNNGFHKIDNISWITEIGNRVQGESSLNEVINDIFYMAIFHKNKKNMEWNDIEKLFN